MVNNLIKIIFIFFIIISTYENLLSDHIYAAEEADQKILGFSLSNFDQENKKTWDLKGDTLEIFDNIVQLTNITANVYGKEEDIVLTADNGTYDRTEGKVHLQDNVVIVSETGAKMMTDTLDWLQKNQLVTTEDKVNIYRGNIEAEGMGAVAKPDLKQFSLNEEVQVDIKDDSEGQIKKTTITCDGPMDIDYLNQTGVFNKNVKAYDGESELYADKMTGYFDKETKKIIKIVAEGNVKIVRGKDESYSEKAIYNAQDQTITLIGRPKLIFYSEQKSEADTQ